MNLSMALYGSKFSVDNYNNREVDTKLERVVVFQNFINLID